MTEFLRYAVYYLPDGAFGQVGAHWLGWDAHMGTAPTSRVSRPAAWIEAPQPYGFHATIKAPFYLANGIDHDDAIDSFHRFCEKTCTAPLGPLRVAKIDNFFALVPKAQSAALSALEEFVVRDLDHLRAPVTAADLELRRQKGLQPADEARFMEWGYPYVFEHFRFHITLTGKIPSDEQAKVMDLINDQFSEFLAQEHMIARLCLVGQKSDGKFVRIHYADLQ